MSDWREKLGTIIKDYDQQKHQEAAQLEQNKKTVEEFLDEVVLPAFKSIAAELATHDRESEISITPKRSVIHILPWHGDDEFTYGLEIRHGHVTPITERVDASGKNFAGESFIFGDVTKDRIEKLTEEDIISDFLEEYARYLR